MTFDVNYHPHYCLLLHWVVVVLVCPPLKKNIWWHHPSTFVDLSCLFPQPRRCFSKLPGTCIITESWAKSSQSEGVLTCCNDLEGINSLRLSHPADPSSSWSSKVTAIECRLCNFRADHLSWLFSKPNYFVFDQNNGLADDESPVGRSRKFTLTTSACISHSFVYFCHFVC